MITLDLTFPLPCFVSFPLLCGAPSDRTHPCPSRLRIIEFDFTGHPRRRGIIAFSPGFPLFVAIVVLDLHFHTAVIWFPIKFSLSMLRRRRIDISEAQKSEQSTSFATFGTSCTPPGFMPHSYFSVCGFMQPTIPLQISSSHIGSHLAFKLHYSLFGQRINTIHCFHFQLNAGCHIGPVASAILYW